jgi:hypothetical protein
MSSSCPECGGDVHQSGEWPDRFRIFSEGNSFRCWCRRCGYFAWKDQLEGNPIVHSHAELEAERLRRIADEEARKRSAERALEHLRNDELWRRYHEQIDEGGRKHWEKRGIPREWQDFWRLGYVDYDLFYNGQSYRTLAESIPIFGYKWTPQNIKMRLDNPPEGAGRYRYVYPNLPQALFLTDPDKEQQGDVVVVEGEVKSAVAYLYMNDGEAVGIPGKKPSGDIVTALQQYDKLTLVADPDAKRDMVSLANKVGLKKCWLLHCPEKIDDAILRYGWNQWDVRRVLKGAIRMADWA